MKNNFDSNKCILIAIILNLLIPNILHFIRKKINKNNLPSNEEYCERYLTEKFNGKENFFDKIINNLLSIIIFQRSALISSTILLVFVVGISVFVSSKDYYKTLITIFYVVILNSIGMFSLYVFANIFQSTTSWGCAKDLEEDGGDLKFNQLMHYYSCMPLSLSIFTYFFVLACI